MVVHMTKEERDKEIERLEGIAKRHQITHDLLVSDFTEMKLKKDRLEALAKCWAALACTLKEPYRFTASRCNKFIKERMSSLYVSDINELRDAYKALKEDLNVGLGDLVGAKEIEA